MFDSTEETGLNNKDYNDQQIQDELDNHFKNKEVFNNGRWSDEEHFKFIEGIIEFGNDWKKVQKVIKTRSISQARSHAQKFFCQIKKYLSLEEYKGIGIENDKGSKDSPLSIKEGNDIIITKHLIHLLSYQDKEKIFNRIIKLSIFQKEKLLNLLISLSNSSDIAIRKRTCSTGIDIEEEDSKDNDDEIDSIRDIDNSNTSYDNKIRHNNKIFVIKKDNWKHKYSDPLLYTNKNPCNSTNRDRSEEFKSSSLNSMRNEDYKKCHMNEQSFTPESASEGDIYNEMKRFFLSKREENLKSTIGNRNSIYSPRVCSNNRPHSTTNVFDYNLLNNKNFFPNKQVEFEQKQNTNPFTLNFDCFYSQNIGYNPNPKTIYEDDNEMIMDVEYNSSGN